MVSAAQGIYDFLNLNRVASETGFFEFVQRNLSEVPVSLYTQVHPRPYSRNLKP